MEDSKISNSDMCDTELLNEWCSDYCTSDVIDNYLKKKTKYLTSKSDFHSFIFLLQMLYENGKRICTILKDLLINMSWEKNINGGSLIKQNNMLTFLLYYR